MGLNVTFYQNLSDNNVLDKTITAIGSSITMNPTETISILNPNFIIKYDSTLLSANYCYVTKFNRYYFCTVSVLTGGRMAIQCKVDALMSAKDAIKNCSACILRNEFIGSNYIVDNKMPIDPNRFYINAIPFDSFAGNVEHYILVLNKGGAVNGG